VGQPSDSTAGVLSKLFRGSSFPSTSEGKRKRSFDPKADIIVAEQKRKKKATNLRIKPRKVTLVLLCKKPVYVPRGHLRKKLRNEGRVIQVELKRCMSAEEVWETIIEAFPNLIMLKPPNIYGVIRIMF
jgi:hypothetical protein